MNQNIENGLTERLARFVCDTRYGDLPATVVEDTKHIIADCIACANGGLFLEAGKKVLAVALSMGGNEDAGIFGTDQKVSAPVAAFANSYLGNVLDADDTFYNSSHPSCMVVFSALAVAEKERLSGKDLIAAVAVGFDVSCRILQALMLTRTHADGKVESVLHRSFGWYVFGAIAAAGKLLRLDLQHLIYAFGMGGFSAVLPTSLRWQQNMNGAKNMFKYSATQFIAFSAVTSVYLAKTGFTADPAIFDGKYNYGEISGCFGLDEKRLFDMLGDKWYISETSIKPFAICRFVQHGISILMDMIATHHFQPDEYEKIEVQTHTMAAKPWLSATRAAVNPIDSQFSFPLGMAATALGSDLGPEWQSREFLDNPKLLELANKVEITVNPDKSSGSSRIAIPTRVIVWARGQRFEETSNYAYGDPFSEKYKMTRKGVKKKYFDFSKYVLTDEQLNRTFDAIMDLEDVSDVKDRLVR